MIAFSEKDHLYFTPGNPNQKWISVTTLLSHFKEPFNAINTAAKCSVRKPGRYPNRWYGVPPAEILAVWDSINKRSTDLGSLYHKSREDELTLQGANQCTIEEAVKQALPQILTPGVYIEFIVYLESAGLAGQIDKIEVKDNVLTINDYKTNKEIKRKGFTNWEGVSKKMLKPLHHLDECEFNTYSLQLSLYAHMISRHNPLLKVGDLTIEHVKFLEDGVDKYGYPILKLEDGHPVVKDIEYIKVPYLKNECIALTTWLRDLSNREKVIKH